MTPGARNVTAVESSSGIFSYIANSTFKGGM